MKTLVLWGDGGVEAARSRHEEGAALLLWDGERSKALEAAGIPYRTAASLTAGAQDEIDEAAMAWTKDWGRRPLLDGKSFRELFAWKGVSLWWFAELYLHHSTDAPRHVRVIESVHRILDAEAPDELETVGLSPEDTLLVERTCTAHGVLFHGPRRLSRFPADRKVAAVVRSSRWNAAKALVTEAKARLAGPPSAPPEGAAPTVLFLSHAAFWRARAEEAPAPHVAGREPMAGDVAGYEHYFDRLIPAAAEAGLRPFVVAVGPRAAYRRRGRREQLTEWLRFGSPGDPFVHVNRYSDARVHREVRRATAMIRQGWERLRRSPALADAFSHRGVAFADLALADLAGTMLLQLPWAVRCYEEMAAALVSVRPAVVCLYAESSGWGRAAVAACRAAGVPTVAIQHGIVYPKYYSYRHAADEKDSPVPDATALFGASARRLLIHLGHPRPQSLVLTGSPRFDELQERALSCDRAALRARLGASEGQPLVVVASRFRAIRDTHSAIGSAFPSLVAAVRVLGVRCLVKPHPAESHGEYLAAIGLADPAIVVLSPAADLLDLLIAADALVTVESLSAVEALVVGRPVVILNMPTHLGALVDAGVALGVDAGNDPTEVLHRALMDADTRNALQHARALYLDELALGVDGQATRRIVDLLRATASAPPAPFPAVS
jgi:CDP-glycerol:poly(glycerophosphate) glycerophosphotransferase